MNLYESITNNLKESDKVDFSKLPEDLQEELFNTGSVKCYVCDNCGTIFKEPKYKNVRGESYYGVGSDFPDSHEITLNVCPSCEYEDIHEQTIYLDDIVDYFIENNSELIYNVFSNRYPEKLTSDTIPEEDYPDECYDIAKELLMSNTKYINDLNK